MSQTLIPLQLLFPALLAGALCLFVTLRNWENGLRLLILVVLLGGIVAVRVANGGVAILFRDIFIVLPLYGAVLMSGGGAEAAGRLPADLACGVAVLVTYILLSVLNPSFIPPLQMVIGLKVWLLYIPFLVVGAALARNPPALFSMLRFFLVVGMIPVAIGLLQYVLARVWGYDAAISLFYGTAAESVTQGFGYFEDVELYRIPSTFSFASQYVQFVFLYVTIAAIEWNGDPDRLFRRIGQVAFCVGLLAGVFSGTRGALVTFPMLIGGFCLFGVVGWRVFLALPVAIGLVAAAANLADIDLYSLFSYGDELASDYAKNWIFGQIADGLQYGPFGAGIGASTGGARYATSDFIGAGSFLGYESYYAKIAGELGSIGLVIFAAFFVWITFRVIVSTLQHVHRPTHAIVAPLAVYIIFQFLYSFKGYVLDTDPGNIFFWLALGIIGGLDAWLAMPAVALAPPPEYDADGLAVDGEI